MNTSVVDLPAFEPRVPVRASKIEAIYTGFDIEDRARLSLRTASGNPLSVYVGIDYVKRHNPVVGGYYVEYGGGQESFCAADVFESKYKRRA